MIPLAINGKSDDNQLLALTAYLHDTHKIKKELIKKDWFILFDVSDYSIISVADHVSKDQATKHPRPLVRHPDIIVFDEKRKIRYVVELDGSSHYRYRPHLKNKWQKKHDVGKRNDDYKYANIPLIVIDIVELKQQTKYNWFTWLDKELKRLGF